MIIIGLTGGIATGKGVVNRAWSAIPGVLVKDADLVVRQLYKADSPLVNQLVEAFGDSILNDDGSINRKALGGIVFNDEGARQKLNSLVHPAVYEAYAKLAAEAEQQGVDVFVIEAALTLDSDPDHSFHDAFVTTDVEESEQLRRLIKRDGLSEEDALRRIRSQLPRNIRNERADYIIDTSGSIEDTQKRALEVLGKIRREVA